ncbi:MAG: iron-containing alcohol dehydrogenase [Gammaproteobacteria bacterium]|nr:iron-containing alcohol dehydrogenase [Gammaproteobacteria bacterium]
MIDTFSIARLPRIEFGRGSMKKLPGLIQQYGRQILLISGGASVQGSALWAGLMATLSQQGTIYLHCAVSGEPSPELIDELVARFCSEDIQLVVAVGGGSVLDAAKAVAGLLKVKRSVMDYLEGVGPELAYQGTAIPFIAVPTTAGTGSEATKNAVLSRQGENGFKKSFRDDRLVAEYAVVDPEWLSTCPPELIAANGMDALTQLLESYVSIKASPITDALNLSGLHMIRDSLLKWYIEGEKAESAMDGMAYAAMLSGITLAQTGLGSVHGLASPLGAFYPISHGVACGTLVAEATRVNLEALHTRAASDISLQKYAHVSEVMHQQHFSDNKTAGWALADLLGDWCEQMNLPRLSKFGITAFELDHIVKHSRGSSMKTNPIVLEDREIKALLESRL